jgi:micrococcal nuclease
MYIMTYRKGRRLSLPKALALIVFLVLALVTILQDKFVSRTTAGNGGFVRVTSVHDGDTISVMFGNREERVRLIGIDAPELGQKPWGMKAKRKLQEMIRNSDRSVRVEMDVEERDKYGRLLAYLWTKDGRLINEEMLKAGYAFLYTIPPNVRYVERLRRAQEMAVQKKKGVWGEKGLDERPSDYRKTHLRESE